MRKVFDNTVSLIVVVIVLLIIIPLPAVMLDVLFLLNIAVSLIILLFTMYVKDALEFSIFPSLLLITTLFRLGLNVSAAKLILGNEGNAGAVIRTFGEFVIGSNPVVGFVVFLIIIAIQFIVINKGAERVAEVTARFTLDAIPGKQMAIDADLNVGAINEEQARERRSKITREADFYSSMDGATKFVKGDAIIALLISIINIIGGMIIGLLMNAGDVETVLMIYVTATVGGGLVSQIPALLISTATGMIVTRSASDDNLSKDIIRQFSGIPIAFIITGGTLIAFILFIPGFPPLTLLLLGGGMIALGIIQMRAQRAAVTAAGQLPAQEEIPYISDTELFRDPKNVYTVVAVEPLEMGFGYSLLSIIDEEQGANFSDRLVNFRMKFAKDMGIVIPAILLKDNLSLKPGSYNILIKGEEVASGEVLAGYYFIMHPGGESLNAIEGIDAVEPTFNIPGKWITANRIEQAEEMGCSVVDPQTVIITHMSEVLKRHAYELIGRSEIIELVENTRKTYKTLVDDLVGTSVTITTLHKVVVNLVREGIPVRDMPTIIEVIGEYSQTLNNNADQLTKYVRQALRRTITRKYADDGMIRVITLDAELEGALLQSVKPAADGGARFVLSPNTMQTMLVSLSENIAKLNEAGAPLIVMTSPEIRIYFKQFIDQFMTDLIVLSHNEIDPKTQIQFYGVVKAALT